MARPKKIEAAATTDTAAASPPNAAADAYAKIEPELAALAPDQVTPIELDFSTALSTVLAAVPRIHAHRAEIVEQLPAHPIANIDNLETYAQAAWYAHLVHTYANGADSAKALIDEATKLREDLLIAAEALAHKNHLNADAVAKIRKGSGAVDIGHDLSALAALYQAGWSSCIGKTTVDRADVDHARELGPAVLVALHVRKQASMAVDTGDQRARAFTLLAAAYNSCRRAVTYVRWNEGDADAIAPSLYRKRLGRKPGKRNATHEPEDAAADDSAED